MQFNPDPCIALFTHDAAVVKAGGGNTSVVTFWIASLPAYISVSADSSAHVENQLSRSPTTSFPS